MPTNLDREKIRRHLENFNLRALFIEELGWDHGGGNIEVSVDDHVFSLKAVAQKRGMVVYQYIAGSAEEFPDYPTRQKIEKFVAKAIHEHIIIYTTYEKKSQHWQWVKREPGRPDQTRHDRYDRNQSGEPLIQKLEHIAFTLEEDNDLTIVDVSGRVRAAFDMEKVSKKFYDHFKKEHKAFLSLIDGIDIPDNREWYASLMLNRMMFIYFIQKRRFLDGDPHYLRNRLERMKKSHGKDRFQTFYRMFLRRLFYEGLNQPEEDRPTELVSLLGDVPYLNGGLFELHELERDNKDLNIPDDAFERIFNFFDTYQWHLDDRPLRNDNEINPDVLGYIFEKYINQKEMGAYYTKEDITGYISRNTVIPFLFDQAEKKCPIAFRPGGGVWSILSENPDRYFHESVRHGITYDINKRQGLDDKRELPAHIAAGLHDVSQRDAWNNSPPEDYALKTETWREHIDRRQYYEEVRAKLVAGEVTSINALVTYNLDIEKFIQDVIAWSEGPELIRAFWEALNKVSILDPTCGSGAFLLAALGILESIYIACLDAMRGFLDDLEHSKRRHRLGKMKDFRKSLEDVNAHANERYFVLKSIIINNLYGIDIMEEAMEICKLRLFLKLVAQLENYDQIEPLPDIDFNICSGNTLVGFTSLEEIRKAFSTTSYGQRKMLYPEDESILKRIEEDAKAIYQFFQKFRRIQTGRSTDVSKFINTKSKLRKHSNKLRMKLSKYLADRYGVKETDKKAYEKWRNSHKPFHWFVEFYGIMNEGGFDVIIGNPPYVSATRTRRSYNVLDFKTQDCPDIYAWVLERSEALLKDGGRFSMIVPLSLSFSSKFDRCRKILFQSYGQNWFSSFGRIPSALFSFDVRVRCVIHIGHKTLKKTEEPSVDHTTRLHRWFEKARPLLFDTIKYVQFKQSLWKHRIPKLNTSALAQAFENVSSSHKKTLGHSLSPRPTKYNLSFKKTAYNWLTFCRKLPPCYEGSKKVEHTQFGNMHFVDDETRNIAMLLANGKLMLAYWFAVGDDFHVAKWNFSEFPIDMKKISDSTKKSLVSLLPEIEATMADAVQYKLNAGRRVGNYNLAKCRDVTDQSDALFAQELGLDKVLDDIELYYTQNIKTEFNSN